MSEGKESYYRERAILAIERGEYDIAASHMKKAEKCKQTKRPTDKYEIGAIIRFAHSWEIGRDFYIVALKIEVDKWLVYGRNSYERRNEIITWDEMLSKFWTPSYSVHVFNEANGKVLK